MRSRRGAALLIAATIIFAFGSVEASATSAPLLIQPAKSWSPTTKYVMGDVVVYDGSSWILARPATAEPPGPDGAWEVLDTPGQPGSVGPAGFPGVRGQSGPVGATGSSGERGPTGPIGSLGPSPSSAAPTREIRFAGGGNVTVPVPGLRPGAVVLLQYVSGDPRALAPASVTRVAKGTFDAHGSPGAKFRYVVVPPAG